MYFFFEILIFLKTGLSFSLCRVFFLVNPDSGKMMAEFLTKDQKSDVEQEINLANLLINIQV